MRLTAEQLDPVLVQLFDLLLAQHVWPATGSKLLAAILHFRPNIPGPIGRAFPAATRALRGWHRLMPATTRQPLPFLLLMALVGVLLARFQISMSLAILLGFSGYLRPRELTNLKVSQLVAPLSNAGASFKQWFLVLHPEHEGLRSKTGLFDESVSLDSEWLAWAAPFLCLLKGRRAADAPLWPFQHAELVEALRSAAALLKVQDMRPCLYSLRHGGASHDCLTKARSIEAIKNRGRWQSDRSLLRYQKPGRAQLELRRLREPVLKFGMGIAEQLEACFLEPGLARRLLADCAAASAA